MKAVDQLAVFGAPPMFSDQLPVGQLYFPEWDEYVKAMAGIFERRYFTNHGPLAQQVEEQLAEFLGVAHAICVTNATNGLMIAATALGLSGRVAIPAFTFIAGPQALSWCGLEPVFCDVELDTHHPSPATLSPLLDGGIDGIMAVNLWGGSCDPVAIEALARQRGIPLLFDSAQAFGSAAGGRPIGSFGDLEVFSFHATKILDATEGGCITTNNDDLAARVRNIRSSYGAGRPVPVPITTNGRFSEAQAALALLGLGRFEEFRRRNIEIWQRYRQGLAAIPGISVVPPQAVDESNWQYLPCVIEPERFGLSRDELLQILKAEGVNARRYFFPGCHRTHPYWSADSPDLPVTDRLCATVLQLPIGALVSDSAVDAIVDLIGTVHGRAEAISARLGS